MVINNEYLNTLETKAMKNITFNLKFVNQYGGASYKAVNRRDTSTIYISPNSFTGEPPATITISAEGFVNPHDVVAASIANAKAAEKAKTAKKAAKKEAKADKAADAPVVAKAKKVKVTVVKADAPAVTAAA